MSSRPRSSWRFLCALPIAACLIGAWKLNYWFTAVRLNPMAKAGLIDNEFFDGVFIVAPLLGLLIWLMICFVLRMGPIQGNSLSFFGTTKEETNQMTVMCYFLGGAPVLLNLLILSFVFDSSRVNVQPDTAQLIRLCFAYGENCLLILLLIGGILSQEFHDQELLEAEYRDEQARLLEIELREEDRNRQREQAEAQRQLTLREREIAKLRQEDLAREKLGQERTSKIEQLCRVLVQEQATLADYLHSGGFSPQAVLETAELFRASVLRDPWNAWEPTLSAYSRYLDRMRYAAQRRQVECVFERVAPIIAARFTQLQSDAILKSIDRQFESGQPYVQVAAELKNFQEFLERLTRQDADTYQVQREAERAAFYMDAFSGTQPESVEKSGGLHRA